MPSSRQVMGAAIVVGAMTALTAPPASAQAEPFIGQIMCAGFNFAPRGWARLDGQLLPISGNDALFSLLGTQYGGDGRTTFGLPDMRGRVMLHPGSGPGLTPRVTGERGGAESHTLAPNQMPVHSHGYAPPASSDNGSLTSPAGAVMANRARLRAYAPAPGDTTMAGAETGPAGGNQPVGHMPPFVGINCYIALVGVFPSRP